MLFELADRTMGVEGHDTFDAIGLIHFDDGANGADVLLDERSDVCGMFATGVEPEDFESPHDSCVGIMVPPVLKRFSLFVGIVCFEHVFREKDWTL